MPEPITEIIVGGLNIFASEFRLPTEFLPYLADVFQTDAFRTAKRIDGGGLAFAPGWEGKHSLLPVSLHGLAKSKVSGHVTHIIWPAIVPQVRTFAIGDHLGYSETVVYSSIGAPAPWLFTPPDGPIYMCHHGFVASNARCPEHELPPTAVPLALAAIERCSRAEGQ